MHNINKTAVILLFILGSLFVFHFTQYQFSWIKLKPLDGYYVDSQKNSFSWKGWFNGSFQETEDKYLTEHFGFRTFFVRLNHQWRFSLFNKAKTAWVTVGKENYLYEENYIKAWFGTDFIGQDSIKQRMLKLKHIQDALDNLEKKIIVVLAPGKGSFYPEYIPESYLTEKKTTNIEVYRHYIEKWGINCIDFNQYFIDNKEISPYPLYPQYGIHWSYYAMCLAADSIVSYIENMINIEMPHIYWDNIMISQPKNGDDDIARAMNLLFAPRSFEMAYPEIHFESNPNKTKPSIIVIADSYYWSIYDIGWSSKLFSNSHFWYYNKDIYPNCFDAPFTTDDIDLLEEILNHDIIIILSTDANLPNFGWGFIENTFNIFL